MLCKKAKVVYKLACGADQLKAMAQPVWLPRRTSAAVFPLAGFGAVAFPSSCSFGFAAASLGECPQGEHQVSAGSLDQDSPPSSLPLRHSVAARRPVSCHQKQRGDTQGSGFARHQKTTSVTQHCRPLARTGVQRSCGSTCFRYHAAGVFIGGACQ